MSDKPITKKMMEDLVQEWITAQRRAASAKSLLDSRAQDYCVQENAPLGQELDYTDCEIKVVQMQGPPQGR